MVVCAAASESLLDIFDETPGKVNYVVDSYHKVDVIQLYWGQSDMISL